MTTETALIQSYDNVASRWRSKIETLGYAAAYRWVIGQTQVQTAGKTVLDAGCGTGDFARALIEVGGQPAKLTLLDPSAQMVATAARSLAHITPNIRPLTADLENAPETPHDIVLCAHVVEHFADPKIALERLKTQLMPTGHLLLVVSKPHWCNWIIWVHWRHKMIKPARLKQHIADAGLRCLWDTGFPAEPPSRSSHAYLITHI